MILIGSSAKVFAVDVNSNYKDEISIILEHTANIVPMMLDMSQYSHDDVYIGQKLNTYRAAEKGIVETDYDIYPIITGNNILGIVSVIKINNNVVQVSCGIDFSKELQNYIESNKQNEFALAFSSDGIYVVEPNGTKTLIKREEYSNIAYSINSNVISKSTIDYCQIEPLAIIPLHNSIYATQFKTLDIVYVANSSAPCCGGLCWAASIAMIANYYRGTSYTAAGIHNLFGCITENYHNEEKQILRSLGMYADGQYTSNLTLSKVMTYIQGNKLLLLDLQDYKEKAAHNVVCHGYYSNGSSNYFYYMDPNTQGCIASFPSSGTIYIPLSGYNYEVHCYIVAY